MADQGLKAQIEDANRRFTDFFNAGRVDDVAGCYTEDAQFLVPGQEPFVGRGAIAAVLEGLRGDGNSLSLTTVEVEPAGDYAWETGRYSVAAPNGAEADRGKYIVVWKQAGGQWRLHRDIINSSLPAPAAP